MEIRVEKGEVVSEGGSVLKAPIGGRCLHYPSDSQECRKIKIQEKSQFRFVKYWKTIGPMLKYCQRGFI